MADALGLAQQGDSLALVKRAATRRAKGEAAFRLSVITAHANGCSLRAIANVAGVSHVRVLQIVRGE